MSVVVQFFWNTVYILGHVLSALRWRYEAHQNSTSGTLLDYSGGDGIDREVDYDAPKSIQRRNYCWSTYSTFGRSWRQARSVEGDEWMNVRSKRPGASVACPDTPPCSSLPRRLPDPRRSGFYAGRHRSAPVVEWWRRSGDLFWCQKC